VAGAGRKMGQWEATSGEKVKSIRYQRPHPKNAGSVTAQARFRARLGAAVYIPCMMGFPYSRTLRLHIAILQRQL